MNIFFTIYDIVTKTSIERRSVMKSMKAMLSTDELIEHMKNKGIKFEKMSEDEAKNFLKYHNYYMKLSAYRTNYPKCPDDSVRAGQYQNLDFAYLKELSSIDKHLRYIVLEMCLDIEHAMRTKLVDSVAEDGNDNIEDGYRIVKEYLKDPDRYNYYKKNRKRNDNFNILYSINSHKAGEYCKDLYDKYYPYFPIWVLVEMISFGDLIRFCEYYDNFRNDQLKRAGNSNAAEPISVSSESNILLNSKLINIIRDLRNASAHSNCLLNKASKPMDKSKQPINLITEFVKKVPSISKDSRSKYLHIDFTYNMTVLAYVYNFYLGKEATVQRFKELQDFMNGRVILHKDYFTSNPKLQGVYIFMKKLVDYLANDKWTADNDEKTTETTES